jgi:hypothetical protein
LPLNHHLLDLQNGVAVYVSLLVRTSTAIGLGALVAFVEGEYHTSLIIPQYDAAIASARIIVLAHSVQRLLPLAMILGSSVLYVACVRENDTAMLTFG